MKSIGDFAESLILGEVADVASGKASHPKASVSEQSLPPAGKDISKVKVPESFRKEILGESYQPVEEPEEVVEEVVQEGEMITEETAQEMVSLLKDVRNLLSEMMTMGTTSAGSICVNLAGPTNQKKKKKESALRSALRQRRGLR
jgi:hypothetical protein